MNNKLVFAGLLAGILLSCSRQEVDFRESNGDTVFYASLEQSVPADTRVYADENLMVLWHADDRVSIFDRYTYNREYRFTGETGDNSGAFQKVQTDDFVTGNEIPNVYAVYPYQASTRISNAQVLTLTLPSEQTYAVRSFGRGANTMVSATEDNNLLFKNVGGYLVLKLYGEGVYVTSLTLKGNADEPLAGKAVVTAPLNGAPSVEMQADASREITLTCPEPVALGASADDYTEFWFVIPPTSFADGFTVTVTGGKGDRFEKSTGNTVTINRNEMARMAPLKVNLEPGFDTIPVGNVPDVADGSTVHVRGLVSAVATRAFVISENDGHILVYTGPGAMNCSLGDIVTVSGTKATYRGVAEITSPDLSVSVESSGHELPDLDYQDITESFDTFSAGYAVPICFRGTLTKSGTQFHITVEGASRTGYIYWPVAGFVNEDLVGTSVLVKGFYQGRYSYTTGDFLDIVATYIEAAGQPENAMPVPEAVDLGLPSGLKWASFNLGASKPEEYGDYYAWGETVPYYAPGYSQSDTPIWRSGKESGYNWASYQYCMGSQTSLTKYCNDSLYGFDGYTDDRMLLEPEDDAAYMNLNGKWRMPTRAEQDELWESCDAEWTVQNGINGYRMTGPNGNSIFLPATGGRQGTSYYGSGSSGNYWSSSFMLVEFPFGAYLMGFNSSSTFWYASRRNGYTVRAVYGDQSIPVERVTLNESNISLSVGGSFDLVATVYPTNARYKKVSWYSSNEEVVQVSSSGVVTGKAAGVAVVSVRTIDREMVARCTVYVSQEAASMPVPEAVDLGLPSGLKWASFNLGASKPEEYGDYYAWGETEQHYSSLDPLIWKPGYEEYGYDWCNYKWLKEDNDGIYYLTKYCTDSAQGYDGFTDGKSVLDSEDDAAHVILGNSWRMPTDAEWDELMNNCSWTWTSLNGVEGYRVTSSKTGNSGQSIFLPAASHWTNTDLSVGMYLAGRYWSSSLTYWETSYAWIMQFNSSQQNDGMVGYVRYYGLSIRPVYAE